MLSSTSARMLRRAVAAPASRRAMSTTHSFDISGSFEVSSWLVYFGLVIVGDDVLLEEACRVLFIMAADDGKLFVGCLFV